MKHLKIVLKHIQFWIKYNHLRVITAVGCIALGIVIGILLCENIEAKHDWFISVLTGLITSTTVSIFLDCFNKSAQKKKDDAIKRATISGFWNNMISQSMHMLACAHPLYHHACDINYMECFVKEKVVPLKNECQNTIQFYSAVLTKLEFDALSGLLLLSKNVIAITSDTLWDTMKSKKKLYHQFYNFLGYKDIFLNEISKTDYNEIKQNVEYIYSVLREYLGGLENAIEIFSYLFYDNTSYINLHSDIVKADTENQGLLER